MSSEIFSTKFKKGMKPWNKGIKGRKLSEETKKKISEAMLGYKNPFYRKKHSLKTKELMKKNHKGMTGKKQSENQKMIMKEKMKGRKCPWAKYPIMIGEKNPKWIKDRTLIKHQEDRNNPEYKQWRLKVYKRDNYKCRINNCDCNGRIIAHHILGFTNYPELRYEVNNGITLCQFHHPLKRVEEIKLIQTFTGLVMQKN